MPLFDRDRLPWEATTIATDRGTVQVRRHLPAGSEAAVVMVGGVGGAFDTPARDLYPRLAEDLAAHRVGTLRIRFRDPRALEEAAYDVLAGLRSLAEEGVTRAALVGHSFGGAVVIRAAADPPATGPAVAAVVTLATQSYGTEPVTELRSPLLLVHGDRDRVLSVRATEDVARRAGGPVDLRVLRGGSHDLVEHRHELRDLVGGWLLEHVGGPSAPS